MAVINPLEKKLEKCTFVQWGTKDISCAPLSHYLSEKTLTFNVMQKLFYKDLTFKLKTQPTYSFDRMLHEKSTPKGKGDFSFF